MPEMFIPPVLCLPKIRQFFPYQAYEYWLHDMYMNVSSPLPVNSNPGWVFPKRTFAKPTDQAVYTARLVKGLLDFKEKIER